MTLNTPPGKHPSSLAPNEAVSSVPGGAPFPETQTKIESFRQLNPEEVGRAQRRILEVLGWSPMTDREIVRATGWTINRVTARRRELVIMGRVSKMGKTWDHDTSRHVTVWGVVSLWLL